MITNEAFKDMSLGTEEFRQLLPCFKDPNEKIRLISVIKDMAGKDLTKITFPGTSFWLYIDSYIQWTTLDALKLLWKFRVL